MKVRVLWLIASVVIAVQSGYAQEEVPLEQVIAMALEKNYDIRLAKNVSETASTNEQYAWGVLLPQLNATGSILWNNSLQTLRFRESARNTEDGNAQSKTMIGSLQLSWVLFDGTKMFATLERIKTISAQGELIVKDQIVNTIAAVIINYYGIVRQKQQLISIQEQIAVSEERVKLADRKLQVGTGGKPELLQARVDYNAQRTQMIVNEAILLQLKEQLNGLVDSQLSPGFDVADSIIIDLNLDAQKLSNNLEQSNFSLKASRLDMEIATLAQRERRAERFPVFSFNSSLNSTQIDNTKLLDPFQALFRQSDGFNYGFSIALPILNGFNTRRQIQQAYITYSRQKLLYDQQKINVSVGFNNAYVNYDNAKKVLLIEEENILLAKENVYIALESFKRSVATFIELRTAQQSLADAYNRLITARYNTKVAETELLRLSGNLLR